VRRLVFRGRFDRLSTGRRDAIAVARDALAVARERSFAGGAFRRGGPDNPLRDAVLPCAILCSVILCGIPLSGLARCGGVRVRRGGGRERGGARRGGAGGMAYAVRSRTRGDSSARGGAGARQEDLASHVTTY
jgi:hypothetical protein